MSYRGSIRTIRRKVGTGHEGRSGEDRRQYKIGQEGSTGQDRRAVNYISTL